VTCCALWHTNIEAMNSGSESMSVDSDNGNAERMVTLGELNRALLSAGGKHERRTSARLTNLNETQRE